MDLKVTSQPASESSSTSGRKDKRTTDEQALKETHLERPFCHQRLSFWGVGDEMSLHKEITLCLGKHTREKIFLNYEACHVYKNK